MNSKIVYFTNAPFNILTDFVLFFLPLRTLAQLQLPRKQKTGLILLFAIGLLYVLQYITTYIVPSVNIHLGAVSQAFSDFEACIIYQYLAI